MTADLRRNVNFGHFTVLHISHPNEQIFTFQVSCGHLVVIFIILKDFQESRKNWRFSWPRTCEKSHFWAFHIFAYFSPKWANIYISSVLWSTGGDFIILKAFPESRINWSFSWPRTCEEMSILGISEFCIFVIQMSKHSHFKCPVVIWWWFSSF